MKTYSAFLFCLIFLLPVHVRSQNYQNICSPGITYFKSNDSKIKAFRRDSVSLPGNNDTIVYSFKMFRDTIGYEGACLDVANGSVLGRSIYKSHDGWFYFFNRNLDTIRINTQANLNQTWRFCALDAGSYLEAKVTSFITDSVCNTTDQVKVLTLQAKNSSNNNIPSLFNQKQVKLSQHYGLTALYDVYFIPSDTIYYSLVGKTNPDLGTGDLTWQKIYDFNIGDVLNYFYYQIYNGQWVLIRYSMKTVLDKTVNTGNNTVDYLMQYCSRTESSAGIQYVFDTITDHYNFNQLASDTSIYFMPYEFYTQGQGANGYDQYYAYGGRHSKWIRDGKYIFGSCWKVYYGEWTGFEREYSEGIGKRKDFYYEYGGPGDDGYSTTLVYYQKGSQTWGTPVAASCNTLVGMGPPLAGIQPDIRITPNPVETLAEISIYGLNPGAEFRLTISDFSGRICFSENYHSQPVVFNRASMPPGMYVLTVTDLKGNCFGRTKMLLK